MAWYRAGTATFTNGNAAVTGSGTAWAANIQAGDAIKGPDQVLYEVQSVNSDTSITMATTYGGSTAVGAAYAIIPTQGRVRDLAAQVVALIGDFSAVVAGAGAGKFGDGTAATPGLSFASDPDCGFYRIGANTVGISTGGALRLAVDSSGHVGIGTATPGAKIEVVESSPGATLQLLRLINSAAGANTKVQIGFFSAGGSFYGAINGGYGASSPEMNFVLPSGTPGVFTWVDGAAERMRIDSSGRLLIGRSAVNALAPRVSLEGRIDAIKSGVAAFSFGPHDTDSAFVVNDSTTGAEVEVARLNRAGKGAIFSAGTATTETLGHHGAWTLTLVSNTALRLSARGDDGVTRKVDFTLLPP